MERIIDVSLAIGPDLLTWPGDPGVEVVPTARLARGDPANVSELRLGSHTGTHVDPPAHSWKEGRRSTPFHSRPCSGRPSWRTSAGPR
jgi:kynurenine formamidase